MPVPAKGPARLLMLVAGASMGLVGVFVTSLALPVHVVVCLRGLFGALFVTIFLVARKSHREVGVLRENWAGGVLLAASNAGCIFFYFSTIVLAGFAVAAFLLYTGGLFAVIFARAFHGEHVTRGSAVAFLLAIAGVALIMQFWEDSLDWNAGILTGILSGVFLGGNTFSKKMYYRTLGPRLAEEYPDAPMVLAWWATLTLGLVFLAPALVYFSTKSFPNIPLVFLLGLVPTAIPFTCFNFGLRADEGGDVLIFSYVEPVVATILSVLFGQPITAFTLLGGGA
ncbi:MAG: DMT family transporter, partial [Promethearchaeota archaeon]